MNVNKILIIGMGVMGMRYYTLLNKEFPKVKIIVYRSTKKINNKINVIKNISTYNDIDLAINEKPDFCILCNPSSYRIKILKKLIQGRINILIEKPISNSTKNIHEIQKLAKNKKVKILVGYNLRYLDSLIYLRNFVKSKKIGEFLGARCEVGQNIRYWRSKKDYKNSVSTSKKLGGGVLLELSHEIDYVNWIFGPIKWVQAKLVKNEFLNLNVEDTAHLLFGVDHNKNEKLISINMDFVREDKTRTCYVIGRKNSVFWDGNKNIVSKFNKKENKWDVIYKGKLDIPSTYLYQINQMIKLLNGKSEPKIKFSEGIQVIEIIEAARRSDLKNKRINLGN